MKPIVERFYRYIKIDTQATWEAETVPASANEFILGQMLVDELKEMGVTNAWMDDKAYVFASIPANCEKEIAPIAFFAHLDTAPDETGANVNPRLVENWDGSDIILNEEKHIVLGTEQFPYLKASVGKDLIVTDGNSLLGADDKAGVAEIMEAAKYIMEHPEFIHGEVHICFTPDEEIGNSTEYITIENVPAKYGYTMDGGEIGEINCENFNAAIATIRINRCNMHPGVARNKMKNAVLLAQKFIACLPESETPASTEKYEGYYNITDILGSIDQCIMTCYIRDFQYEQYEKQKELLQRTADFLNQYYGEQTFEVTIEDYYLNMKQKLDRHPEILKTAKRAMELAGLEPKLLPIRGGTDGVTISYKSFPCPNLFSGSHNGFSIYEYISVQAMQKAVNVIVNIIQLVAEDYGR